MWDRIPRVVTFSEIAEVASDPVSASPAPMSVLGARPGEGLLSAVPVGANGGARRGRTAPCAQGRANRRTCCDRLPSPRGREAMQQGSGRTRPRGGYTVDSGRTTMGARARRSCSGPLAPQDEMNVPSRSSQVRNPSSYLTRRRSRGGRAHGTRTLCLLVGHG